MLRSRFFWRVFGGYALAVAVFAAIVGVAVGDWVVEESMADIRRALRSEAALLREQAGAALAGRPAADLQDRIRRLGRQIGTRLTVIRADGAVLADSAHRPDTMDDHSNRPEILRAKADGHGFANRFSDTLQSEMTYCAVAVEDAGQRIGYVRTALSSRLVGERLARVRGLVILGAAIAALVALGLGVVFTRGVTRRLETMTGVAQAIAAGDYARRVPRGPMDEIGKLAQAYNVMAEELQVRIDTITEDRNTLQAILGSMVEGVVAVDRDEVVLHMNAVAGELLDVRPAAVIGQRLWEVVRINDIAKTLQEGLAGHTVVHRQVRLLEGDEEHQLDISASPLTDAAGQRTGAVVVFFDVTAVRRLEEVRRDFVVNASHELKTPITALRGFLETMVQDPEMPADTRIRFLGRAQSQAERLSALVTDLLQLSRFESDAGAVPAEPIDLREVVRRSVSGLQSVASEKSIDLAATVPTAPVMVGGDDETLALVVDNLVDNAIKYSGAGGRVRVTVEVDAGTACVSVRDDGIGIHPDDQGRIFERFYRVDKARSRAVGGTGLGLSIVKHACGILGAQLSVTSKLGMGSTFRVQLPRVEC